MTLWHAYVDESGDRGWIPRPDDLAIGKRVGSSQHFSMTAVLVPDGSQTALLERWSAAASDIGRPESSPLHWQNVRSHSHRLYLCQSLAGMSDLSICSVVLSKWDLDNVTAIKDPTHLYNWTLRLLIERLSWFGKRACSKVVMHFAQVKGLPPDVIAAYLGRLQSPNTRTEIEWNWLHMPARVNTPRNQRMLQVADTASGAVYAAFEWDAYGNVETRYLETILPRIWCPPGGQLHDYGLKVAPWPHPRHDWLAAMCARK